MNDWSGNRGLDDIGPLVTWAVVVLGADDTRTEVIPMPEPLPDKPRIAGGFDFQAKQPDKPRFCSKRRRTSATNLRRLNVTTGSRPATKIVWSPNA